MLNRIRPTFSNKDRRLSLTIPKGWDELTQRQLRYVLTLIMLFPPEEVKAYMIIQLSGMKILKRTADGWLFSIRERWWKRRRICLISAEEIASLLHLCDFIDSYDNLNTRLVSVDGCRAVDKCLHGVSFGDYLNMENLYQGYLMTKKREKLTRMAKYLYRTYDNKAPEDIECSEVEAFGVFVWYTYIKSVLARFFPHFFTRINTSPSGEAEPVDMLAQMNIQIRALTDGDVTKEEMILNQDCWRALTELDAKAHEAAEFNKKDKNG